MVRFVLRKLLSKKWMALSLLVGNVLLAAIVCSSPMYTRGMLQKVLIRRLDTFLTERNSHPGVITSGANIVSQRLDLLLEAEEAAGQIGEKFGAPVLEHVTHYSLTQASAEHLLNRTDRSKSYVLGFLSDLPDHARITSGRMYSDQPDEDGVIDVIVSERGFIEMDLLLDEVIEFPQREGVNGQPLRVRVVGVFTNSMSPDPYWVNTPSYYRFEMLMSESLFRSLFILTPETQRLGISAQWFTILDYRQFQVEDVPCMQQAEAELTEYFTPNRNLRIRYNFSTTLDTFSQESRQIRATLLVLEVPILALLVAFLFMVSRQMLEMEQAEIAVLKSRGAGKAQIISVYLLQSVILSAISYALAIPLGMFICQVVGSSNAFLEFVSRSALELRVDKETLLYGLAASLLSILAMSLPALRYARMSIVNQKQRKHRRSQQPLWQRLFLDIIILGVSLYGLYNFNNQKALLAQRVLSGESLDPLLYFSSSLFMLGAGLTALRIIPLIIWCVYQIFKKLWSPALYASFLRVLRTRSSQGFIMVFLMLTIALGIFNAQAARTINSNKEENIRYTNGADIRLMDRWASSAPEGQAPVYSEPDFGRYATMEGSASATRVLVNNKIVVGNQKNVTLMGIHTKEFGETAYFPSWLTSEHWFNSLNLISQDASAVLLSRSFETNYGYKVGDTIYYRESGGSPILGVVYGFVDYFPGFAPTVYVQSNGSMQASDNYLVVAHLAQIQSKWGVTPYEVWMKAEDSTQFIYDYALEHDLTFARFRDTSADLVALKNDPIFQGTNGILTVGFIVVLILCGAGFLIYWILSIRSRTLQFGIYRAMGLTMREIVTMLLNEQFFISGLSIAAGAGIGVLATRLFIPLIQIAYTSADQALPLEIYTRASDMYQLFGVVGAMILVCLTILGSIISRMKIAQALKLGED